MEKPKKTNQYRHIARVTIEAATPIAVGTGVANITTDSPVARDVNGLPYIPGTSLAGVIRHTMETGTRKDETNFFGYHDRKGGLGARISFTDAQMVGKDGTAVDGIQDIDFSDGFYAWYSELPIRNHVKIGENGTHEDTGKFDNEVVYKGTRFVFEIELVSDKAKEPEFDELLTHLYKNTMRIGSGTRCGYGKIAVVGCKRASIDLSTPRGLASYIRKSSDLSVEWDAFSDWKPADEEKMKDKEWTCYRLRLEPMDFYLFGSGFGDDEADNVPVAEPVVEWKQGKPEFSVLRTLVPASSVKGVLAHRTAYNYNRQNRLFAGSGRALVGEENPAVRAVFGFGADNGVERGARGNIILGDVIESAGGEKLFCHVKIDYFTGGTIDGNLFQEKSTYGHGNTFEEEILVKKSSLAGNGVREAFEQSLKDLCRGLLPLGGCVGRGNGFFSGELYKDGELL